MEPILDITDLPPDCSSPPRPYEDGYFVLDNNPQPIPEPLHPWWRIRYLRAHSREGFQSLILTHEPGLKGMMFFLGAYLLDEECSRILKKECLRRLRAMSDEDLTAIMPTWVNSMRQHSAIRAAFAAQDYYSYRALLSSETMERLEDIERAEQETDAAFRAWLARHGKATSSSPGQTQGLSDIVSVAESTTNTPAVSYLYREKKYLRLSKAEYIQAMQAPIGTDNSRRPLSSERPTNPAFQHAANALSPPPSPATTDPVIAVTPATPIGSQRAEPHTPPDTTARPTPLRNSTNLQARHHKRSKTGLSDPFHDKGWDITTADEETKKENTWWLRDHRHEVLPNMDGRNWNCIDLDAIVENQRPSTSSSIDNRRDSGNHDDDEFYGFHRENDGRIWPHGDLSKLDRHLRPPVRSLPQWTFSVTAQEGEIWRLIPDKVLVEWFGNLSEAGLKLKAELYDIPLRALGHYFIIVKKVAAAKPDEFSFTIVTLTSSHLNLGEVPVALCRVDKCPAAVQPTKHSSCADGVTRLHLQDGLWESKPGPYYTRVFNGQDRLGPMEQYTPDIRLVCPWDEPYGRLTPVSLKWLKEELSRESSMSAASGSRMPSRRPLSYLTLQDENKRASYTR